MSSGMIFKNPDTPKNHKPVIAAGAVMAYSFLKSKGNNSAEKSSYSSSEASSEGYSISLICLMLCIVSPFLWVVFAAISPAAVVIATWALAIVYGVSILRFIYVLFFGK